MIDKPGHTACPGPCLLLRQPHADEALSQHASARITARSQTVAINIRLPAMWARLDKVGRALASHSIPHRGARAHGSATSLLGHRQTHRRTGILPHTWDMRPGAQHHPLHASPPELTVMLVASSAVLSALLAKRIDQHTRTTRQATRHNERTPFEHRLTTPSKQGNRTQQMNQKPTVHAGIHLGSPRALCK